MQTCTVEIGNRSFKLLQQIVNTETGQIKGVCQEKNKWSKNVLNGLFSSVKDIYLDNVRFELNSAQLKEIGGKRFLYIVFQMIGANDLVLTSDALLFNMSIHIPSSL